MTDREPMVASSLERIFPIPGVTEDWDDVLERAGEESALRPETGLFRKRPARVAIAFVALAAVAVAALLIGAPWKSSPGFLERAQAGLVPPPRSILHQRFETTVTSKDFGCTVTTQPSELWIDLTPPHRWRVLADDFIQAGLIDGELVRFPGCDARFVDVDNDEAMLGAMAGHDRHGRPANITGSDAKNVCHRFDPFCKRNGGHFCAI